MFFKLLLKVVLIFTSREWNFIVLSAIYSFATTWQSTNLAFSSAQSKKLMLKKVLDKNKLSSDWLFLPVFFIWIANLDLIEHLRDKISRQSKRGGSKINSLCDYTRAGRKWRGSLVSLGGNEFPKSIVNVALSIMRPDVLPRVEKQISCETFIEMWRKTNLVEKNEYWKCCPCQNKFYNLTTFSRVVKLILQRK